MKNMFLLVFHLLNTVCPAIVNDAAFSFDSSSGTLTKYD